MAVSHIESSSSSSISNVKLDCAYLGRSKESLDQIELSIQLDLAVAMFGGFLRYVVSQEQPAPREPTVNAFEVMMSSQRQLCLRRLPEKKMEHNSKDRLYNAILDLLQEKMLDFPPSEVDSVGINLVKTLQECLWYIDGRHKNFEKQSCPIPAIFSRFVGFNLPEKSKHRKCTHGNMQHDTLSVIHQFLFGLLQIPFLQRASGRNLSQKSPNLLGV